MKPMQGFYEQGVGIALGILFIGVIAGLAALTFNGMFNSSFGIANENATGARSLLNMSAGVLNFSQQLPTVGLVGGIAIVLIILFGAVAVFMPKK